MKKSKIFIISGPSGAGKDAIISGLKEAISIRQLITTVSRPMRPGEKQGAPYFFITKKEFAERIKRDEFFEYDEHFDNYYGLTYEEIEKAKADEEVCFWQAEYKGVITAKKKLPEIIAIFINAPLDVLIKRMKQREEKMDEKIYKQRLHDIEEWLKHKNVYDYEVINEEGKLDEAIKEVKEIIEKNI